MSITEIDRTSTQDLGQDGPTIREDAEADSQQIGGDGEHGQKPAEQGVQSDEEEEEVQAPAAAPSTSAGAKKIFGTMRRPNPTAYKKGNDAYNYEEKYPEDPIYEETTPNARVWRVHEDESRIHDANMVEESRDNVDVLLVFAGLFSAVVTTFVAQTSQNLQVDYAAMSASLLYESVLVQRAIANGSSVNSITPSPLNPTIAFVPATTDVWANGLWFTSLFLSLTTALVAVLVKQWLHHYVALPSGTPRDRSLTRQFRYGGFQKWGVLVIIGLLPVLMHLALAIFLVGLVIFLQPLRQALSWTICVGTSLVYGAYMVVTILPIIFPQCPYRTPLCDLVYVCFCRIIPQVSWDNKSLFLKSLKLRRFNGMFRYYLPRVQARNSHSLTMIESKFVQQTSTDLAPEALHWLFSVSSNPTVQSIVVQSIGGLPMASEEVLAIQRDDAAMDDLQASLLCSPFQQNNGTDVTELLPGVEVRRLERLFRFCPGYPLSFYNTNPDIDSFELSVAILSSKCSIQDDGPTYSVLRSILSGCARGLKLPPSCWLRFVKRAASLPAFKPLVPDEDDHANMFPLDLCSAILDSFARLSKPIHDFDSPLVLDFNDALPYFVDKIYDEFLGMFSEFVKDGALSDPSLPKSLRASVMAIKFLLHRLSLPEFDMSHATICESLQNALFWIFCQAWSDQEATTLIMVLQDIIASFPPLNSESDWSQLCHDTIRAYHHLTTISPSACSVHGLQSMVTFMKIHWDHRQTEDRTYQSDIACDVLTGLLSKCIPEAFTVFLDGECLQFLGSQPFREISVPMVSAYIAGIFAMQQGSDGAMDADSLRQHTDYLHDPQILFTVCSTLAVHDIWDVDQSSIRRDITTLVQLCPPNTVRDVCRRKLDDLVQSEDRAFFSEQRICSGFGELHPLRTEEIEVEKENIRHAIRVLDGSVNDGGHTSDTVPPDSSPGQQLTGHIHHFLGWCLGRKHGSKPEQEDPV